MCNAWTEDMKKEVSCTIGITGNTLVCAESYGVKTKPAHDGYRCRQNRETLLAHPSMFASFLQNR